MRSAKLVCLLLGCERIQSFRIQPQELTGARRRHKEFQAIFLSEVNEWETSEQQLEKESPRKQLDSMELTWRHVKKPLVRIGSKGTTLSHGNSLRQLLEAHTVVKVKVNNRRMTLEDAFVVLRDFAVASGASSAIELIQVRDRDNIMLIGLPGTLEKIALGTFPPEKVIEVEEMSDQ